MRITKLEHACLDIQEGTDRLIVDPGGWTTPPDNYDDVAALVITHVHADHFDPDKVAAVIRANPKVRIFTTQQVADKLTHDTVIVPRLDQQYGAGAFVLEFFGGQHAVIMDDYPRDQNFGVLVNNTLYYPGDSLTPCPKPHTVLALPVVAPWLKLSEAADFLRSDNAQEVFPTHNNIVNANGEALLNRLLKDVANNSGKTYHALTPGQAL